MRYSHNSNECKIKVDVIDKTDNKKCYDCDRDEKSKWDSEMPEWSNLHVYPRKK